MGWFELLRSVIILCYFLGTLLFFLGVLFKKDALQKLGPAFAVAGFVLHTLELGHFLYNDSFQTQTIAFYVRFLSWCMLAIFFLLWWRLKLKFLALTTAPLALLLFLASLTVPDGVAVMPKSLSGLFFGLHIGSFFLSFGLLAVAFGAGLIFLHLNKKIKTKEYLTNFDKEMPALSSFDKANHWAVVAGFPLFTLGLLSGFIWARFTWGKIISWDPKEIVSVLIWFLFALLFHQRLMQGWRGRKPALLAIWLFVFAIVSLVGINFFMPTHHSFKP